MKIRSIITAILAAMMMIAPSKMSAQEDNGFKKFSVEEAFEDNGFQWFRDAQLLCAGSKEKSNAMTIGWGGIGTLWRKTALTVYVAEKRYTKEFLDNSEYFTVMSFDVKDSKVLNYMGTKSGRDGDKAQPREEYAKRRPRRRKRRQGRQRFPRCQKERQHPFELSS